MYLNTIDINILNYNLTFFQKNCTLYTRISLKYMKKLIIVLGLLIAAAFLFELVSKNNKPLFSIFNKVDESSQKIVTLLSEESAVIDVVEEVGPSVVTIGIRQEEKENDTFDLFFPEEEAGDDNERYIGSGFVVQKDGLIVTNKHVISERGLDYLVIDDDGNTYEVESIYRDPANDIAILQTESSPNNGFKEIEMGDSSTLKVGQFVIAIGTALGEFPSTVTTGVVSGLGRGITAGSPYEGFVEELDNVVQTDAAINPGNSGGPLLNSSGQVIAVNTAVSGTGENIGFAIPINIVKDSIKNFNNTGRFSRPYLGVSYTVISERSALLNEIPQGAFVQGVIEGSAADEAGIETGDIITKIESERISEDNESVALIISNKKVGDTIEVEVFRDRETLTLSATLKEAPNE